MNQADKTSIQQAIELAQAGKKDEAYQQLKQLSKNAGGKDPNLLLWIAFTTSDMAEAEAALNLVETLDPANPNLPKAKEWYRNETRRAEGTKPLSFSSSPAPSPLSSEPAAVSSPGNNNPVTSPIELQKENVSDDTVVATATSGPFAAPSISAAPIGGTGPFSNPLASSRPDLLYSKLSSQQPEPNPYPQNSLPAQSRLLPTISRVQGFVLIGLVAFLLIFTLWNTIKPEPKWEYKTVTFFTEGNKRTGDEALKYASIEIDQKQLATLGGDGWELVSDYLEIETAFPNFGDSQYVTGLQPNIRPQSLVLIFKRKV